MVNDGRPSGSFVMAMVPWSVIATSGFSAPLLPLPLLALAALLALSGLPPSSPGLSSGSGGSLAAAFGGAALELALGSAARAGRARATTTIAPARREPYRRRPVMAAFGSKGPLLSSSGTPSPPRVRAPLARASPLNASARHADKGHSPGEPRSW